MRITEKIYNGFLKFFGDIKVFKYPLFILYDPGSYKIRGDEIREVIKIIEPGDILIRGYINYLDGYFIPGFFSHAGLYLGQVIESDRQYVPTNALDRFKTGEQMVIHAMAEGVFMEDVINFCRCDYMVILRRNLEVESQTSRQITFDKVFQRALSHLGKEYDFKFDFNDFHKFSCTELVYDCCKDFITDYGITIKRRKVLFTKKMLLIPDDFVQSTLNKVWQSKQIPKKVKRLLQ